MESYIDKKKKYLNFLEEYLELKGVNTKKLIKCFSKEHEDKHPSMSFFKKNNTCHCFACGETYDIFKLVGQEYNLKNFKEQFQKVEELYNNRKLIKNINETIYSQKGVSITIDTSTNKKTNKYNPYNFNNEEEYRKYIRESWNRNKELNNTYLEERGISKKVQNDFFIGYDDNFKILGIKKAIIIPTSLYSFTARNVEKTAENKQRIRKVGQRSLFGQWTLKKNDVVFITEGEIDALSFFEIGKKAISLGSKDNGNVLIKELKNKNEYRSMRYILMLDSDIRGKEAQKMLYEAMKKEGFEVYKSKSLEKYGYKDPNDFLTQNRKEFETIVNKMISFIQQTNNQEQEKGWGARATQKSGLGHGE